MTRASFSPKEIADMHGVSEQLIRKMVREGQVAKVESFRKLVRIPAAEVERVFGPVPESIGGAA